MTPDFWVSDAEATKKKKDIQKLNIFPIPSLNGKPHLAEDGPAQEKRL